MYTVRVRDTEDTNHFESFPFNTREEREAFISGLCAGQEYFTEGRTEYRRVEENEPFYNTLG